MALKKRDYWEGGRCIHVLPLAPKPRVKSFHLQYYVRTRLDLLDFVQKEAMVLFQPIFVFSREVYLSQHQRQTGLHGFVLVLTVRRTFPSSGM